MINRSLDLRFSKINLNLIFKGYQIISEKDNFKPRRAENHKYGLAKVKTGKVRKEMQTKLANYQGKLSHHLAFLCFIA